ncbi:hypothetical protein NPIL_472361 [Nephila pilipes]|uniref:Uncharacterized protein n=1 Tax=Nephila pilipes TaxID=299642 RepID=A0A8X6PHE5_NEPPI|nr:hypothetical protein NPIL_436951 [Nephila pilipes]GFT70662.1 hypothetical protein NPIL_472361 [Nephila pilipes]
MSIALVKRHIRIIIFSQGALFRGREEFRGRETLRSHRQDSCQGRQDRFARGSRSGRHVSGDEAQCVHKHTAHEITL